MNQLSSLQKFTSISIDSGDINSIKKYKSSDATTNPSLILQIVNLPCYNNLVLDAINYAKQKNGSIIEQLHNASDKLLVNVGIEILKYIPGYVSIEIDSRLSFDTKLSVLKALKLISMFEKEGIDCSRILIKLAATWEGIKAAEILKKKNIKCNLTLLFSFAQAIACAESKVFLISPFVGRIYDWFIEKKIFDPYSGQMDPGVLAVKKIYKYYKQYNYKTIIMGASFRNIEQIINLAGCDKLTISPVLLNKLQNAPGLVNRSLFLNQKVKKKNNNLLTENNFRWQHNQDAMAVEKLSEGIRQFSIDQIKLEKILFKNFNY